MPELETERLRLRCFQNDDLEELALLAANDRFMRFSGGGGIDREKTAAMLERIMVPTRAGRPALFAVMVHVENRLIGSCGFLSQVVDDVPELEIAYRLHPDFWQRGLATEAARAVRDHAFADLGLERVISLIHIENHASRRVVEKLGMTKEKHTNFKGFPTDVYVIRRAEWESLSSSR